MTSEEIFACAHRAGLIDKSESGDWFVRPDAEVKEVFKFANLISVVEGLVDSEGDEILAMVREKERDMNHKEIERLRNLSFHRLNKINSLRVNNKMREKIQALTETEKNNEIRRLREALKWARDVDCGCCSGLQEIPYLFEDLIKWADNIKEATKNRAAAIRARGDA